ncbi:hypothetical protein CAPTEDRAFT_165012 [Capitella teleta]|uniref:Protein twisted gastrulation n=1 Tax=Capitella teleta TaxID=283909 RepID=R7VG89_CAPTE|nr:hypothetical protein CAPTEDRAFT_165012 [Capitella teleta]|eukprot:ELU17863.1 hypothetical protein CAPTEDRAFT_165012 [Capitella teleta]
MNMTPSSRLLTGAMLLFLASFSHFWVSSEASACDQAICASLVSKCLLMKSCECDMTNKKNCTCCQQCHRCLSKLYTECCSCVGMCPERADDDGVARSSTVEILSDPIPELFDVLTEEVDPLVRWTTYTYPAHLDLLYFKPDDAELQFGLEEMYKRGENAKEEEREAQSSDHPVRHNKHHLLDALPSAGMNCTVAFMAQCMSLRQCKDSCSSMGAARYRWFHEHGCCECVGSSCLDYGKAEALCYKCPLSEKEEEEEEFYFDVHGQGKYQDNDFDDDED